MILAAGRGKRMRPLTDLTPKPLLVVGGKPLLFWHLEKLAHAGFAAVTINYAHLGEQIEAAVGDGSRWALEVRYSPEVEALETAGGIRNALPLIGSSAFAVVNGDVYCDYDYSGLAAAVKRLADSQALAHLVLVGNPPHHPKGDFCLEAGLVRASGRELLTFSGLGAYRAELFEPLARGAMHALAPLLRSQLPRGKVTGEHYRGLWTDVGTPARLAELDARLQPGAKT
ncbi:MAG: N-acetylmuramate alpha-1-phosphate uridylyltransferase MurU [Betaproteobacteria bacterium]